MATAEAVEEVSGFKFQVSSRPLKEEVKSFGDQLAQAVKAFVVRRGDGKTVIAGYPWFLDWGRDTLIFCRGMIAAGMKEEVLSIIRQFASFEQGGTLPNMIIGDNAGNRDSSDAPLWLFAACQREAEKLSIGARLSALKLAL